MITEDEFDLLIAAVVLIAIIIILLGIVPGLSNILPSLFSGIFRMIDIIKDQTGLFKYI